MGTSRPCDITMADAFCMSGPCTDAESELDACLMSGVNWALTDPRAWATNPVLSYSLSKLLARSGPFEEFWMRTALASLFS